MGWSRVVFAALGSLLCAAVLSPATATPFANVTAFVATHLRGRFGSALPSGITFTCDGLIATACDTSLTASYRGWAPYRFDQLVGRTITIENTSAVPVLLGTVGLFTDVTSYAHISTGIGVDDSVAQSASFASSVYLWFSGLVPGLLDEHSCSTGGRRLACPGFSGDDNAYTFPLAALAPGASLTVRTAVRLSVAVDTPEPASLAVLAPALLAAALLRLRMA